MRYQILTALLLGASAEAGAQFTLRSAQEGPLFYKLPAVADSSLRARMILLGLRAQRPDTMLGPQSVADTVVRVACPMPVVKPDTLVDRKMVYKLDAAGQAPMPVAKPGCRNTYK